MESIFFLIPSVVGLPDKIHIVFVTHYAKQFFTIFLKFKISWLTIILVAKSGNHIFGEEPYFYV